jgi:hypothetical protein
MALDWTAAQALLDALPGVAYVVGLDGRIVACGAERWRTFAEANGAPELGDSRAVLGRALTEFIEGESARQADECIRDTLRRSGLGQIAYDFRGDSPDRVRRMRMHISLLREGDAPCGFLYQSLLLSEKQRPVVTLFAPRLPGLLDDESPIITACSYCKRLRHAASGNWLSPEEYAEAGGRGDARISHGICDECYEGVSAEFFGGAKER